MLTFTIYYEIIMSRQLQLKQMKLWYILAFVRVILQTQSMSKRGLKQLRDSK